MNKKLSKLQEHYGKAESLPTDPDRESIKYRNHTKAPYSLKTAGNSTIVNEVDHGARSAPGNAFSTSRHSQKSQHTQQARAKFDWSTGWGTQYSFVESRSISNAGIESATTPYSRSQNRIPAEEEGTGELRDEVQDCQPEAVQASVAPDDVKGRDSRVMLSDLISYCDEFGIDHDALKFTAPDYFIENVHISHKNPSKIRQLMVDTDMKYLREEQRHQHPAEADADT